MKRAIAVLALVLVMALCFGCSSEKSDAPAKSLNARAWCWECEYYTETLILDDEGAISRRDFPDGTADMYFADAVWSDDKLVLKCRDMIIEYYFEFEGENLVNKNDRGDTIYSLAPIDVPQWYTDMDLTSGKEVKPKDLVGTWKMTVEGEGEAEMIYESDDSARVILNGDDDNAVDMIVLRRNGYVCIFTIWTDEYVRSGVTFIYRDGALYRLNAPGEDYCLRKVD